MKRTLTDRVITALKAASDGKPYDVTDATTPGLAVRVMPSRNDQKPAKTFVLVARYAGPRSNPTRRSLGRYGEITLDVGREKARRWLDLIAQGKDPAEEEKRIATEAERRRANTLGNVIEDFIAQEAIGPDPDKPKQRRGRHVARELRRVIVPLWGKRPIADITRAEVQAMIEAVRDKGAVAMLAAHGIKLHRGHDRPTPTYARSLLSYIRSVFGWAIGRNCYGIESSPCDHIRAERILGARRQRTRSLGPDELFAFWRTVTRMPYPIGPAYQLLALAGLRLNEVLRAERTEFDLRGRVWTIPESRMKGRNGRARAHAVPLTPRMLAIIDALPSGTKYLFTKGSRPHYLDDKEKTDLDRRMLRTLRAMAWKRGEDSSGIELAPWVNHDLRRTLRSALSQFRVGGKVRFHEDVKEAVLAHVKGGIRGTYDVYDLLPEKREALEHWDRHLMRIVAPPRVVPLRRAG
jgi:integrase